MQNILNHFKQPSFIIDRTQALGNRSKIPPEDGVYAWYFRNLPVDVPTADCRSIDDKVLMYIGISPVNEMSGQNLQKRIIKHFNSNAYSSTLRLTLGVILARESGFPLRRVGSGKAITLTHEGERWLDDWMNENAFVTWYKYPNPWEIEGQIIDGLSLPFNILGNEKHNFYLQLKQLRKSALYIAKNLPVVDQSKQKRRD